MDQDLDQNPRVNGAYVSTISFSLLGYPLSDGGARVLSYDLEMNNDNSRHWAVVATLPDPRPPLEEGAKPPSPQPLLSYTVTDLEPGTQYQFRVVSRNDVGVSADFFK